IPRHMLQNAVKYDILVPHGVDPFCCPESSANVQDTEESTPCALSTKTKPDSRGPGPGMTMWRCRGSSTSSRTTAGPAPAGGRQTACVGAPGLEHSIFPVGYSGDAAMNEMRKLAPALPGTGGSDPVRPFFATPPRSEAEFAAEVRAAL